MHRRYENIDMTPLTNLPPYAPVGAGPALLWCPQPPLRYGFAEPPRLQQRWAVPQPDISLFWLQLAWQLVQAPSVRTALADAYPAPTPGGAWLDFLRRASACLAGTEMQPAFAALLCGMMNQGEFIERFAQALRG